MSHDERSTSRPQDLEPIRTRRAMFSSLAGVAGLVGLAGCRDDSAGCCECTTQGGAAMTDTIATLRAVVPDSVAHGVTVLGLHARGDGGGGVFVFDAASGAADDGATVVRPEAIAAGADGRFVRVIVGNVVSPRLFGAGADDDTAAIEAALAYLAGLDGGGTLLVDGRFTVTGPITIPHDASRPIGVVGLGLARSEIAGVALPTDTALLSFGEPIAASKSIVDFRLEGLTLRRDTHGTTFEYFEPTASSGEAADRRLENATIRDVEFITTSGESGNDAPNVRIQFPGNCTFDGLRLDGGSVALQLITGTRTVVRNVQTSAVATCTNGVHVLGGGALKLENVRLRATSGGFGVKLENCAAVVCDTLGFQGTRTNPQIWISGAQDLQFLGCSTASRTELASDGEARASVKIDGVSSLVTFRGGHLFPKASDAHVNSVAIDIGPECRAVHFDAVGLVRFDGNDSLVHTEIALDPAARDVDLDLRFVNFATPIPSGAGVAQSRYRVRSALPTIPASSTISIRPTDEVVFVTGSAAITAIAGAYAGQRTTFIFLTPGCSVVPSASIRLPTTFEVTTSGQVLELVSDGTNHYMIVAR